MSKFVLKLRLLSYPPPPGSVQMTCHEDEGMSQLRYVIVRVYSTRAFHSQRRLFIPTLLVIPNHSTCPNSCFLLGTINCLRYADGTMRVMQPAYDLIVRPYDRTQS